MNEQKTKYQIDPKIERASTLPGSFYRDEEVFELLREKIFPQSWQLVSDTDKISKPGSQYPFYFIKQFIDEPLLLVRENENTIHCLSNTCTHRANMLVETPCDGKLIKCRYHGRQFSLDGKFHFMPEFEGVENFPSESDHLKQIQFDKFHKLIFCSLDPKFPLNELINEVENRCGWMPHANQLHEMTSLARDYEVNANWALYIDNFQEGLHIPYIHRGLNKVLDFSNYETHLFPHSTLQIGIAKEQELCFDLPRSSPDFGKRIAAYYFWLFPNTMLNIYPWGISVNVVKPQTIDRCVISFRIYVWDEKLFDLNKMDLHSIEMEDEAVVERAQVGIHSRYYKAGRYSPRLEKGVHHFHRLLCEAISNE